MARNRLVSPVSCGPFFTPGSISRNFCTSYRDSCLAQFHADMSEAGGSSSAACKPKDPVSNFQYQLWGKSDCSEAVRQHSRDPLVLHGHA